MIKLETGKIDPSSAATAIKALQWLSAKEDPKRYSDVSRSEVSGPEGKSLFPEPRLSDLELARSVAWVLHLGEREAENRGDLRVLPNEAAT